MFSDAADIMKRKRNDYSSNEDPLRNIKSIEALGIDARLGVIIRILDKISRIKTLMFDSEQQVMDESRRDTIVDAINYLCILYFLEYEVYEELCSSVSSDTINPTDILCKHCKEVEPSNQRCIP
jgi:hypothetical protein